MDQMRKRASKEKSLQASNEPKKSKPTDCSYSVSSTSSGGTCPNEYHLRKTNHAICNGDNGRINETKSDSSSGVGDLISTEGTLFGRESLEDQATVFKKADDKTKENWVETEQNHTPRETGHQMTLKEDKVAHEGKVKKSKSVEQSQNEESKSYTCVCGKRYTSSSHLLRHQETHVGDCEISSGHRVEEPCEVKVTSEKSFTCICGKSYTISSHLYRHQKTCHAGSVTNLESDAEESRLKPYSCACGKRYTSSSHLYRHQRSHVDGNKERAKTFICECGKMFSSRSHLYRHQRTHTLEKVQIEGDSVEDTETEAPGRKPYLCACGKSYTSSSHLYRHQRTHQDENVSANSRCQAEESKIEKPYKCECGKSYTSTSHLYRHQKTHTSQKVLVDDLECSSDVHSEDSVEKPYQCECGKSFILWFSLMVHKRVHCKAKLKS